MKLICGKGGYVRSIARDMGEKLGCFGHVINLTRVSSGPFLFLMHYWISLFLRKMLKK